jgi:hypothetical protein
VMCSLSRFIVVATLVGVAASSLTGSDAVGWLAAGAAAGLLWTAERLIPQFRGRSCPVPASPAPATRPATEPVSPLRIDRSSPRSEGVVSPAEPGR